MEINDILAPLINKGQSINHIFVSHADEIGLSEKTIYNYIGKYISYQEYRFAKEGSLSTKASSRCSYENGLSISQRSHLYRLYFFYGADIPIVKKDEEHFICHVKVAVSPHFLSWIMSFGKQAKIISPDYVVEKNVSTRKRYN